jgi:glutaminyl-tRNA synthetase
VTEGKNFLDNLNPDSLSILKNCLVEPGLVDAKPELRYQFLRNGYFCLDPDSTKNHLVFNRTASLRDTWAKIEQKQNK